MKHIFLTLSLFILTTCIRADEGMWLPQFLKALNIEDMKRNGFKLTAEQLYSINRISMKDGVALFGGGCTAEVISKNGLLLTNHHCGYGAISALSTVDKNHLKQGFFAKSPADELPCKGLSVSFVKSIVDVSLIILNQAEAFTSEQQRDSVIKTHMATYEAQKKTEGKQGFVRGFYYGRVFYWIETQTFTDIRLVGAPPEDIGKFGGETDNWVWPRHNADFSLFRIYANAQNAPSDYNSSNIPYRAPYHFTINATGVKEGDFTMVYGFPGRTQEYLPSAAVAFIMNQQDPLRVEIRKKRLEIIESAMQQNDTLKLMYANKHAGIANAYKKWSGELVGLKETFALQKKQTFESELIQRLEPKIDLKTNAYSILNAFVDAYKQYAPLSKDQDLFQECILGVDLFRLALDLHRLAIELQKKKAGLPNQYQDLSQRIMPQLPYKNVNLKTDHELGKSMLTFYFNNRTSGPATVYADSLYKAFNSNAEFLNFYLFQRSILTQTTALKACISDFENQWNALYKDPLFQFMARLFSDYQTHVFIPAAVIEKSIAQLQRQYMSLLLTAFPERKFYPDANSTLRIAYGKVEGYTPKDGIYMNYFTTLDGLIEKHATGAMDFNIPERLKTLYTSSKFNKYAATDGKLHTAFIASNHTTGGNSGSPVLNAKGELIGTNFDRNWEGTMSDISYDVKRCRNIVLDIRFTLWLIDVYADAGYLLKDMDIIWPKNTKR